jgi:hypothetical protein
MIFSQDDETNIMRLVCPVCGRCLHFEMDIPLKNRTMYVMNKGDQHVSHKGNYSTIPGGEVVMGDITV